MNGWSRRIKEHIQREKDRERERERERESIKFLTTENFLYLGPISPNSVDLQIFTNHSRIAHDPYFT